MKRLSDPYLQTHSFKPLVSVECPFRDEATHRMWLLACYFSLSPLLAEPSFNAASSLPECHMPGLFRWLWITDKRTWHLLRAICVMNSAAGPPPSEPPEFCSYSQHVEFYLMDIRELRQPGEFSNRSSHKESMCSQLLTLASSYLLDSFLTQHYITDSYTGIGKENYTGSVFQKVSVLCLKDS